MPGGPKFERHTDKAIMALLQTPDIATAAKTVGVAESTLWKWLQQPEFSEKYREAKRRALNIAISKLQQATGIAVETLKKVASDESAPASARVSAAKAIIETAIKATEIEELTERVDELERLIMAEEGRKALP